MTSAAISRRRGRKATEAERLLWRTAMREARPLAGKAIEPLPEPLIVAPTPRPEAIAPPPAKRVLPPLSPSRSPGLDRRTGERLKRGQLPIEARLDLHGMTQAAARAALDGFIADGYRKGLRAVLVITGRGLRAPAEPEGFWAPQRPGVLRREVPRWLNEGSNRPLVLAFTEAQPEHGGAGAFYLLLRRQRP